MIEALEQELSDASHTVMLRTCQPRILTRRHMVYSARAAAEGGGASGVAGTAGRCRACEYGNVRTARHGFGALSACGLEAS